MINILIVDDSPHDRSLLGHMIGGCLKNDCLIQEASTVEEAIDIIGKHPPEMVFLDIHFGPGQEGFHVLKAIRSSQLKDIPVLLVSSFEKDDDKVQAIALGADDFIDKPIRPEDVHVRIAVHRRLKQTRDNALWAFHKTNQAIKSLYKDLERKNEKLKELDQLKSEFVATVSHELRTPLAIIRQGVSLFQRKVLGDINEKQSEALTDVLENVDRLVKIINDLLDIAKLESGKIEIRKSVVDPSEFLPKIIKEFRLKAEAKGIIIEEQMASNLPKVEGDWNKLIQVMTNLLGNAVKFTPQNGRIIVGAKETAGMVRVSISDNGRGISKEDMPRLFSKFQQFGRTSGPGEMGTGLGLAISKEIVKLHGGQIWAESEPDKGSTFYFTVPKFESPEHRCAITVDELLNARQDAREENFAVIIAAISNMDFINSTMGGEACEKVMADVLNLIDAQISRSGDKVMSYGPGKIMVVLPRTDRKGAVSVCAKINQALETGEILYADHVVPVKLAYGIADYPGDGNAAGSLIKTAHAELTRHKKILIVDDHPQIVRLLTLHLQAENKFECSQARDGIEALSAIREQIPDLIICDLMMPRMNGYELIGHLKEHERTRDIPVLILTAHQVDSQKIPSVVSGSTPVITKTAAFDKILEIVNKLI